MKRKQTGMRAERNSKRIISLIINLSAMTKTKEHLKWMKVWASARRRKKNPKSRRASMTTSIRIQHCYFEAGFITITSGLLGCINVYLLTHKQTYWKRICYSHWHLNLYKRFDFKWSLLKPKPGKNAQGGTPYISIRTGFYFSGLLLTPKYWVSKF